MTEEQKIKLEQLKEKAKDEAWQRNWRKNALLQECLNVLTECSIISDKEEITRIVDLTNDLLSEDSHKNAKNADRENDKLLIEEDRDYYIVWDDASTPIVECKGKNILECWDEVMAVAFHTCLVDEFNNIAIFV